MTVLDSRRSAGRHWQAFLFALAALLPLLTTTTTTTTTATTDPGDTAALRAIQSALTDPTEALSPTWRGNDPCGGAPPWSGVLCEPDASGVSHVTELRLMRMGLGGTLSPAVGALAHLQTLNVMWNGAALGGPLPPELGSLPRLAMLLLSGNNLSGALPPELGNLAGLTRLQVDSNAFSGALPPALATLRAVQHLHMSNNSFSGPVPPGLGDLPDVVHIVVDNNRLTGRLPPDLFAGAGTKLEIVQLDNNPGLDAQEIGDRVPPQLVKLSLRNCNLVGAVPGVGGGQPVALEALDLRDNRLTGGVPDLGGAPNLSTVALSGNRLAQDMADVPSFRGLGRFQALVLAGNNFTGALNATALLGGDLAGRVVLLDLQRTGVAALAGPVPAGATLVLAGTPLCAPGQQLANLPECRAAGPGGDPSLLYQPPPSAQHDNNDADDQECAQRGGPCSDPRAVPRAVGPNSQCACLFPVTAWVRLTSPSFAFFDPYRAAFQALLAAQFTLLSARPGRTGQAVAPHQVLVRNYSWEAGPPTRLTTVVQVFPPAGSPGGKFGGAAAPDAQVDEVYTFLADWEVALGREFGSYELLSWDPGVYQRSWSQEHEAGEGGARRRGMGAGAVAGVVVAAAVLAVALALAAGTLRRRRRRRRRRCRRVPPLKGGSRASSSALVSGGGSTSLPPSMLSNVTGVRALSFDDLHAATDGFSPARKIGQGGYGKVYRGDLDLGGDASRGSGSTGSGSGTTTSKTPPTTTTPAAIKRAQQNSLQGAHEFYTEIQLLSRVHHRNLVRLLGFCDDAGEQMLVYEYVPGGTLRDHLSPTSPPLTFQHRVRIALGSARGIAYLHNEAAPPIFHRDIKATNILLDARGNAKVADFGLSKLAPATDALDGTNAAHVSTVVKGTPGYLDPEYFLTHKLTDKSDVYSFGVVLLELATGLHPIAAGKNLVREVGAAWDAGKVDRMVDPRLGEAYPPDAMHALVTLALACCKDDPDKRPSMAEVVRVLEDVWRSTPWDGDEGGLVGLSGGTSGAVSGSGGTLPVSTAHAAAAAVYAESGGLLVGAQGGGGHGGGRGGGSHHDLDDDSFGDATDVLASRTIMDVAPR